MDELHDQCPTRCIALLHTLRVELDELGRKVLVGVLGNCNEGHNAVLVLNRTRGVEKLRVGVRQFGARVGDQVKAYQVVDFVLSQEDLDQRLQVFVFVVFQESLEEQLFTLAACELELVEESYWSVGQ